MSCHVGLLAKAGASTPNLAATVPCGTVVKLDRDLRFPSNDKTCTKPSANHGHSHKEIGECQDGDFEEARITAARLDLAPSLSQSTVCTIASPPTPFLPPQTILSFVAFRERRTVGLRMPPRKPSTHLAADNEVLEVRRVGRPQGRVSAANFYGRDDDAGTYAVYTTKKPL